MIIGHINICVCIEYVCPECKTETFFAKLHVFLIFMIPISPIMRLAVNYKFKILQQKPVATLFI